MLEGGGRGSIFNVGTMHPGQISRNFYVVKLSLLRFWFMMHRSCLKIYFSQKLVVLILIYNMMKCGGHRGINWMILDKTSWLLYCGSAYGGSTWDFLWKVINLWGRLMLKILWSIASSGRDPIEVFCQCLCSFVHANFSSWQKSRGEHLHPTSFIN